MIITAMAMYLNTVYGGGFEYIFPFLGDILLVSSLSMGLTIKNIIKKEDN